MFTFATSNRIVFGRGTALTVGAELDALWSRRGEAGSRRVLLVTGSTPARAEPARAALAHVAEIVGTICVAGEPTMDVTRQAVDTARRGGVSAVVAIGGGSALDLGKAVAALLTNPGDPLDYAEVIGRGQALTRASVPFIALPTTAGTGAEVTRNAVLRDEGHGVKVSLRSDFMLPEVAIVDSALTDGVPRSVTAATGMDAITQVIEPFVSGFANPLTDALCREGIRRGARSIRAAYRDGTNAGARDDMAFTSLMGGLALANAKLGAVHGFAAPIGGMFEAPHGEVCARLLPLVLSANVRELRRTAPEHPSLEKFRCVAALVTGDPAAEAEDAASWAQALCEELGVRRLSAFGITPRDVPEICAKAAQASSMKGNPVSLGPSALAELLAAAL